MKKVRTVFVAIQTVLFFVALILLAVNEHEFFQDFMIISIFCGGLAENRSFKIDDE